MIITKTPLRISLFGGGTDVPEFYQKNGFGAVISFAINKYVYVSLNEKFEEGIRVSYSETENVTAPSELKHNIVREALKLYRPGSVEIVSVADIPGRGSGLGSSSAFTVGLVRAVDRYFDMNTNRHPHVYADNAYYIERELCKQPVGKQDHYAAAYGGLHYYQFNADETVFAELIPLTQDVRYFIEENLMLFWTGKTRPASPILEEQRDRLLMGTTNQHALHLRDLTQTARMMLKEGNVDMLGTMLDHNWELKKWMTWVSDPWIDEIYSKGREAGATGGKLLGAGGGGFMLFAADKHHQADIERAVGLRRVKFSLEERGGAVVYRD